MKLSLVPFRAEHRAAVSSWPRDLEEARAWAGQSMSWPVDPRTLDTWHADADTQPRVALDGDELVAYGQLWIDREEDEVELARIIVDPARRNAGVGVAFVKGLVEQAARFACARVVLRVVPGNTAAIRCYERAAFVRLPESDQQRFNEGQPLDYVWMQHRT